MQATRQKQQKSTQQEALRQRLPFVIIVMIGFSVLLVLRIISFQFPQDPRVVREFAAQRDANAGRIERVEAPRGTIYDRDGDPLAYNVRQYRIGISPNLVSDPAGMATDLAQILGRDELEIFELVTSDNPWEMLAERVDATTWQQISQIDSIAITVDRVQQRVYPQGSLGAQIIGFVAGDGEAARGYNGVEGFYNQELSGTVRDQEVSQIPFDLPEDLSEDIGRGSDLVLTLDRDIQFLVEQELQLALDTTGARGGTIIVMNPRNGHILGMASLPSFDPNEYYNYAEQDLRNPAISDTYEPGSVFKVLTVAAALETGSITPDWTYVDNGLLEVGGRQVQNWDDAAYGLSSLQDVITYSLNIGAATIATQAMTWQDFYGMLDRFGMGSLTSIDMEGEQTAALRTPNSITGDWSASDLATNSFGQGIAVTPLQMLTAINAIANSGLMMEPRIALQRIDGDTVVSSQIAALGRPISAETAQFVTNMMVAAVRDGLDFSAQLPGYTIAGKTGTAQIPSPVGYLPNEFAMTFVGFLPADDPQVSILVYLDRPTSGAFASQTAAPVFSRLAAQLVLLLEIPPDDVRQALAAQGASINGR